MVNIALVNKISSIYFAKWYNNDYYVVVSIESLLFIVIEFKSIALNIIQISDYEILC